MRSRQAGARRVELSALAALLWVALLLLPVSCDKARALDPAAHWGAESAGSEHALLGAAAPDFEIAAYAGDAELSLKAHRGKLVIVDFWATWCLPCKESFPFYQSLLDKYAGRVVVLAISVDEDRSVIADFVADAGVTFPVGWDEGQAVSRMYEPELMPTSYLIDENGVVQHVHVGFKSGDDERIVQVLERLLK